VSLPSRHYVVNGERRSFTLLRPSGEAPAQDTLRDTLLAVFADHVPDAAVRRVRD